MMKPRPYVAYDDAGYPWAVSYDRDKIFAYAERHDLHVRDVTDLDTRRVDG